MIGPRAELAFRSAPIKAPNKTSKKVHPKLTKRNDRRKKSKEALRKGTLDAFRRRLASAGNKQTYPGVFKGTCRISLFVMIAGHFRAGDCMDAGLPLRE